VNRPTAVIALRSRPGLPALCLVSAYDTGLIGILFLKQQLDRPGDYIHL
jgi:hypothetical protein